MNLSENFVFEKNVNRNLVEKNKQAFGADIKNAKCGRAENVFNLKLEVETK